MLWLLVRGRSGRPVAMGEKLPRGGCGGAGLAESVSASLLRICTMERF